jgi:alcohol dehydrogenase class IV
MAHKIGGEFGVTHGLANAILLPYVIAFNRNHTDKYAYAEHMLGIPDLAKAVSALNKNMDIPCCFKDCTEVDFAEDKFLAVLDRMSRHAFEDPCTLTNPGTPTPDDVKMLFEAAYYGKTIA